MELRVCRSKDAGFRGLIASFWNTCLAALRQHAWGTGAEQAFDSHPMTPCFRPLRHQSRKSQDRYSQFACASVRVAGRQRDSR